MLQQLDDSLFSLALSLSKADLSQNPTARRDINGSLESEHDYKLRQIDYITLFAALLRSAELKRTAANNGAAKQNTVLNPADWAKAELADGKALGLDW